jgi:hypothetical protein
VISGLPLFLHSRLATVDESPASDSKQAERIEGAPSVMIDVIPFTREEKWSFARVRQGMDEMEPEPLCSAFKRFLELSRKTERRTLKRKGLRKPRFCIEY